MARKFVAVQCPVFCEPGDEYKVEQLLSGRGKDETVQNSLCTDVTAPLALKLRPQDVQCHAVESTATGCKKRLLLKVLNIRMPSLQTVFNESNKIWFPNRLNARKVAGPSFRFWGTL